jgi:hypothetical protein
MQRHAQFVHRTIGFVDRPVDDAFVVEPPACLAALGIDTESEASAALGREALQLAWW